MSARRPLSRLASLLVFLFLFPLFQATGLAQGQGNGGGKGGGEDEDPIFETMDTTDSIPPEIHFVPDGGAFADSLLPVTIYWCDDKELDASTRKIRHGFSGVVGSFTWQSIGFAEPCNVFGDVYKSEGTIDLSVSGSLSASIEDEFGHFTSEQASYSYSPPQPPTVTLEKHNGDNRDRSLCLTAGAGEAAAFQCGDLLVAHAMPAYATKGRDRSLSLIYNSEQAAPRAVVTADLAMPAPHNPNEIEVTLKVGGVTRASAVYDGVFWSGQSYQISIGFVASNASQWPTGLYPFELTARAVYDSLIKPTTVYDTLIIVNRSESAFGQGWSLAGIERLVLDQPNATVDDILRISGDGSARRYRKSGSVWIGAAGAFRDTITLSGGVYTRTLKHGVKVQFNSSGEHIKTINRVGDETTFTWQTLGAHRRLTSIHVPTAGATTRDTYTLHYSGSPTALDSIVDPTGRVLAATVNAAGHLTGLTDPDGEGVSFGYQSIGRMNRRTNRRGFKANYIYNYNWRLTEAVMRDGSGAQMSQTLFMSWDDSWQALGLNATPVRRHADPSTNINGPRTDVADITKFWIDRWGAPTRIQDPLFNTTWIQRDDPDAPALPSRIAYPDGRVLRLDWNGRANLRVQNDSTIGAVSEWFYSLGGSTADSPDSLRAPDGEVTSFTYTTNGLTDRVTAPNGHVTDFDYGSGNLRGLVASVTEESVATFNPSTWDDYTTDPDLVSTFTYDDWGNVETQTSPLGNTTTYVRDNKNRVDLVIDAVGDTTGRTYDALNRVTATHAYTSGGVLTTTRDWGIDFLHEVIDPRGVTRGFEYDDAGRLVKEIDEQGEFDKFGYDEAGNRIWAFTRLLQSQNDTIYFRYDAAGRLKKKHWPALTAVIPECSLDENGDLDNFLGCTAGTAEDSITFKYDEMGRIEEARNYEADPAFTITRTYRDDGLILSDVRDDGIRTATNRYDYSPGGKRTLHVVGSGSGWTQPDSVHHVYDTIKGELVKTAVEWGYGSSRRDSVLFYWDSLGRRKRLLYSSHSGTSAPIDVKLAYDKDGRLRRICSTHGGGVPAAEDAFKVREAYSYNDDGTMRQRYRVSGSVQGDNVCTANSHESAHGYAYDQRKQVVADTATSGLHEYDFDSSGNLTEQRTIFGGGTDTLRATFTIPAGSNRITEYDPNAASAVHYDHYYYKNGTRRAEWWTAPTADPIGSRLYSLDGLGRMAAMTFLNDCESKLIAQGIDCHFNLAQPTEPACLYDPMGRLVYPCGNGSTPLTYDGDNVVRTHGDQEDDLYWSFVHSPGIDNPIMGHRLASAASGDHDYIYFVTDGGGRQLAVGDSTGLDYTDPDNTPQFNQYVGRAAYAGGIHSSFGFSATRQPTGELAGISFFRNRWLDTRTGRWTQEDPIGLAGGVNLYQYVGNNPAAYTDPFGLCPIPPSNCVDAAFLALDVYDFAKDPSWGTLGGVALGAAALLPGIPSASGARRIGTTFRGAARGHRLPRFGRDGKLHGDLPDGIPGTWSRDDLLELATDLRHSIQVRRDELMELGNAGYRGLAKGQHGKRMAQEEELLRRVEKVLSGS